MSRLLDMLVVRGCARAKRTDRRPLTHRCFRHAVIIVGGDPISDQQKSRISVPWRGIGWGVRERFWDLKIVWIKNAHLVEFESLTDDSHGRIVRPRVTRGLARHRD